MGKNIKELNDLLARQTAELALKNRELEIETALEKIRSRSLEMFRSDELKDVIGIMSQKLKELGVLLGTVAIQLFDQKNKNSFLWAGNEFHDESPLVNLPYNEKIFNEDTFLKDSWEGRITNQSIINREYSREQKDKYFTYVFAHNDLKVIPQQVREFIMQAQSHIACLIVEKNSALFVDSWNGQFYDDEMLKVLKRTARVFEQAYVRFNDLKLAEAHAEQAELDLIKLKEQKKRTEDALTELKETQKQLIQSEKMASLGELTAGIAHEIQNPLNFVNNFSEVNTELIGEMEEEIDKGNLDEAKKIARDIRENQQKINHHGKRADSIVKGMLQHSRTSTSQKEPTDINVLADEYLRLAYHGLRAKDKTFNATMKTDFDETIGKINVIPQDIGRVILNLITNAFYAVDEKRKLLTKDLEGFQNLKGLDAYQPTVSVGTKRLGENVLITVKDNGNGIPPKVLDKIFQPFFTTKPTGQGTGLGLSLAYDIVKTHSGELKVDTKEGEGSEFIIQLHFEKNI